MADVPPVVEYASPPPARKKFPPIIWWFLADMLIFVDAVGYLFSIYKGLGPLQEPEPEQTGILELWIFVAQALFMFLLGWATCGWWRSQRAG